MQFEPSANEHLHTVCKQICSTQIISIMATLVQLGTNMNSHPPWRVLLQMFLFVVCPRCLPPENLGKVRFFRILLTEGLFCFCWGSYTDQGQDQDVSLLICEVLESAGNLAGVRRTFVMIFHKAKLRPAQCQGQA